MARALSLTGSGADSSAVLAWIERRVGLRASGVAVLAAAVGGFVLGRATQSRAVFMFVYGTVLVLGAAWLLGRKRMAIDSVRSEIPTRIREGQSVDVELSLTAKRRLSTVILEESLPPELGQTVRVPVASLPAGQEMQHSYTFGARRRGVYEVGPLSVEWSDPFGFSRRSAVLAEPTRVIVHPSTEIVSDRITSREWEDPPIRPPFSKPWPVGFEFYGMRDYVSGDDPRRIVWRKTAQTLDENGGGRYLVRESEQGITDRVNIYLDTSLDDHSPGDPSETFELAVRAAASVGARHLKDGFSLSLHANGSTLARGLRSGLDRITYLDALAAVQRERVPFRQSLDRLVVDPHRNAHNVLVTPYLSQEAASRLRLVTSRGTSVLVVLVMWEDSDPVTLHRAAGVGASVVEVRGGVALDRVFAKVLSVVKR